VLAHLVDVEPSDVGIPLLGWPSFCSVLRNLRARTKIGRASSG
jgi:hypothetical protein